MPIPGCIFPIPRAAHDGRLGRESAASDEKQTDSDQADSDGARDGLVTGE